MEDIAHTVARYADVFGFPRMTMAKQFRHQGEGNQLPRGLRGQRVPYWEAKDHTFATLGTVGNQPIDAVGAAQTLYNLTCCTNDLTNAGAGDHSGISPILRGTLFGDWYTGEVETYTGLIQAGHTFEVEADPHIEPRQIIMSLNPVQAVVVRHVIGADGKPIPNRFYLEHFAGSDPNALLGRNTPPHSRQTHITDQVLIMAGTLLAASRAKRSAASKSNPAPGRASEEVDADDATPKKVEAAGSGNHGDLALVEPISAPASTAASASRSASASSPHKNRFHPLNKVELMGLEEEGQPSLPGTYDHSGGRVWGEGFLTL